MSGNSKKTAKEFYVGSAMGKKKKRKGRAIGGIVMRVKKGLNSREEKGWIGKDGIMVRKVKIEGEIGGGL